MLTSWVEARLARVYKRAKATNVLRLQVGASMGHVPRMSFGRARYDLAALGLKEGELMPGARALSPQAQEVASRTYVAGKLNCPLPSRPPSKGVWDIYKYVRAIRLCGCGWVGGWGGGWGGYVLGKN
jgi:hypothetical protein